MPRQIVAVSVAGTRKLTEHGEEPALAFAAVCSDGTAWAMDPDCANRWYQLPAVSTDEEIAATRERDRVERQAYLDAHAEESTLPLPGCDCERCLNAPHHVTAEGE